MFLYKEGPRGGLEWLYNVERAKRPARVPVVLTEAEVRAVSAQMDARHALMAGILYGAGLRLMECVRLRVKDGRLGYSQYHRARRQGRERPGHDLPALLHANLLAHLERVKAVHQKGLEEGFGEVYLPFALARRYPRAGGSGGDSARPVLRPAGASVPFLSRRNGGVYAPPSACDQQNLQRAVKKAVREAGIPKPASCHTLRHRGCDATERRRVRPRPRRELGGERTTETLPGAECGADPTGREQSERRSVVLTRGRYDLDR